jgi:hypothetical protein
MGLKGLELPKWAGSSGIIPNSYTSIPLSRLGYDPYFGFPGPQKTYHLFV